MRKSSDSQTLTSCVHNLFIMILTENPVDDGGIGEAKAGVAGELAEMATIFFFVSFNGQSYTLIDSSPYLS